MRGKMATRSTAGNALAFVFLFIIGAFIAIPLYFSVLNSFKPISELFLFPPRFVVYRPTLENFLAIFRVQAQSVIPMERYMFNSIFVAAVSTAGYVFIASMAAYPLAKRSFRGKSVITWLIVFAILFRPEVTAIPQYTLMAKTYMLDTYWALILPAMGTSFGVFLMKQFTESVPDDLLEAADIDGAGDTQIFFRIILPTVRPAWLTLTIFTFLSNWNISGAQFTYSESMKLLPVMLQQINSGGIIRVGVTAATSVLIMIPPIVIFLLCQNSVVETMAHSGIKS